MERAGSAAYQVFLDAVTAAVEEGSVQGSVEDVAVAALSIVHGLAILLVDGPVDLSQRPPRQAGPRRHLRPRQRYHQAADALADIPSDSSLWPLQGVEAEDLAGCVWPRASIAASSYYGGGQGV